MVMFGVLINNILYTITLLTHDIYVIKLCYTANI
jgi:hypothetical protein